MNFALQFDNILARRFGAAPAHNVTRSVERLVFRSRSGKAIMLSRRFCFGSLEKRVLLAFAPAVSGAAAVENGADYLLHLTNTGNEAVTSWSVNWGDGSSLTQITGTPLPLTATDRYSNLGSYGVLANASSATRTNVSAGAIGIDVSFDSDGKVMTDLSVGTDQGHAVAVDSDGRIVVAGVYNVTDFALTRYLANGSLDATFGTGGTVTTNIGGGTSTSDAAYGVAIDSQGRIVAAGGRKGVVLTNDRAPSVGGDAGGGEGLDRPAQSAGRGIKSIPGSQK